MYRLYISKLNMSDILEKLSAKYRVSKRALCTDWQKRTQWVYDVFDLERASTRQMPLLPNSAWSVTIMS